MQKQRGPPRAFQDEISASRRDVVCNHCTTNGQCHRPLRAFGAWSVQGEAPFAFEAEVPSTADDFLKQLVGLAVAQQC
eukprot:2843664-Lingulodinium_polyedra.AAC.1